MRTKEQLIIMLTMQEAMQVKNLGPNWRIENPQNYGRAIAVEACEAMDHAGFKWWMNKAIDMDQVIMEGIDMLHFELCGALSSQESLKDLKSGMVYNIIEEYWAAPCYPFSKEGLLEVLDDIAIEALQGKGESSVMEKLIELFKLCNLTGDDVFKLYVGKNALNKFRKNNGYKDGTYIKIWDGREDNEVLTSILRAINLDEIIDLESVVYGALSSHYKLIRK